MHPGAVAATRPGKAAYIMGGSGRTVTYGQLDDASRRLARALQDRGVRPGDLVAILMENNAAYLQVVWAAQRSGLYYTTVSPRLTVAEAAYILEDAGAVALVTSVAQAGVAAAVIDRVPSVRVHLVAGGPLAGYEELDEVLAATPPEPAEPELEGRSMLYSSGTTGQPKGVRKPLPGVPLGTPKVDVILGVGQMLYDFDETMVLLSPAPLYHAAPLWFSTAVTRAGGTVVIMERFDASEFLRLVERHRATHALVVPTMFVRLLRLPEAERAAADVSSLRCCIHGAAPCPIPVKQQMIEWWGPVVNEYYGATEGNGFVACTSAEWLARPGTVGQSLAGTIHVLDDDGSELPPGHPGTIYVEDGPDFEYHNDPAKTAGAHNHKGWSTLGDVGYLDEDGWLFLTDRKAFTIISGGVNVYPQEAENALVSHPRVLDAAVFGIPHDDLGEAVHAVVQPVDMAEAGPALEDELLAWCRQRLAGYKCPRRIDFDPALPRDQTGKLYKAGLRDRYRVAAGS
ncbi:MAG TPA: AMP-binding protein [Acidimicrobiales bacterium]|nr:AMP-binding protein [Acidimicrobiales bacterium]